MGKLPYIPDKNLYAAVMGACSYVKATGYFHKACSYYANRYDVDEEDVEKYVRIAQGNGQKSSAKAKRQYHWYAVEYSMGNERNGEAYFEEYYANYTIKKATSPENVKEALSKNDNYLSEYSPCHWFGRVIECESKEKAMQVAHKMECDRNAKYAKSLEGVKLL